MKTIRTKRQAAKFGLGIFYQEMLDFTATNEDENEPPGVSLGTKDAPTLIVGGGSVAVGLQSDFIRPIGVERLPKQWAMIRTDESEGEQLLEVVYDLARINDSIPRGSK